MSAWDTLKTYIDDNIRSGLPNGIRPEEEHNPVLQLIVDTFGEDYTYMGVATTSTNPTNDDNYRYYIASDAGTYSNFLDVGASALTISAGELCILKGVDDVWEKEVLLDDIPTGTDVAADIAAAVLVETNRATAAEGVLTTAISDEETRALAAESDLSDAIDDNTTLMQDMSYGESVARIHEARVTTDGGINEPTDTGYFVGDLKNKDLLAKTVLAFKPNSTKSAVAYSLKPNYSDFGSSVSSLEASCS